MKRSNNEKRSEADARNERWASLTPKQQLAELDLRLGIGVGAAKQRAKILKRIEGEKKIQKEGPIMPDVQAAQDGMGRPEKPTGKETRRGGKKPTR